MWRQLPLFTINSMNKDTEAVMWVVCVEDSKKVSSEGTEIVIVE